MKTKTKRCECCNQILKDGFPATKYCSHCFLYNVDLRRKYFYYKKEVEKLRKEKYGQKRGSERLR